MASALLELYFICLNLKLGKIGLNTEERNVIEFALNSGYVVVPFYPWFNFYFLLFYFHYHTLPYTKTKENKN